MGLASRLMLFNFVSALNTKTNYVGTASIAPNFKLILLIKKWNMKNTNTNRVNDMA